MDWMKRAWNGQERLWKVFWIYGVVFGIVLGIIGIVLAFTAGAIVCKAYAGFQIVYWVFLVVSQWRCAFNASWRGWGYIVRFLVILGAFGQVYNVYTLFFDSTPPGINMRASSGFSMKESMSGSASMSSKNSMVVIPGSVPPVPAPPGSAANNLPPGAIAHSPLAAAPAVPAPVVPASANGPAVPAPMAPASAPVSVNVPAPAGSAPVVPVQASAMPVPAPANNQDKYKAACEQYMGDYAKKNGVNPQDYIAKNQAYLQQCIQVYAAKDAATTNKAR